MGWMEEFQRRLPDRPAIKPSARREIRRCLRSLPGEVIYLASKDAWILRFTAKECPNGKEVKRLLEELLGRQVVILQDAGYWAGSVYCKYGFRIHGAK